MAAVFLRDADGDDGVAAAAEPGRISLGNSTSLRLWPAQLWYPQDIGHYAPWYLPLLLLVMFRPRLVPPDSAGSASMQRSWLTVQGQSSGLDAFQPGNPLRTCDAAESGFPKVSAGGGDVRGCRCGCPPGDDCERRSEDTFRESEPHVRNLRSCSLRGSQSGGCLLAGLLWLGVVSAGISAQIRMELVRGEVCWPASIRAAQPGPSERCPGH
ncbi:MAG UNVERIFIED_CONTAM: hypothetical protein LVR18_36560 [Planctomycetaceae bacterium]|jgi:hypothetical protein